MYKVISFTVETALQKATAVSKCDIKLMFY